MTSCTDAESIKQELAGTWSQRLDAATQPAPAELELRANGSFVARNLPAKNGCPEQPGKRSLSGAGAWSLYDVSLRVDLNFKTYEDARCRTPILLGVFVQRGLFKTALVAYPRGVDDLSARVVLERD